MLKGTRKSKFQKRAANKSANKHRKGIRAIIFPWLRRFGMVAVVFAAVTWVGAWFFLSDADTRTSDWVQNKIIATTAAMGFVVDDVYVEGRVHTDPAILKAIINVDKGSPLFSFNPADAKTFIERISWVETAHVERRWPGTIYIALEERKPIALWQKNKKLHLLDEKGAVIAANSLAPFKDLIIVLGEDAPKLAPALIADLMAEDTLFPRIESAMRVSGRRWDIALKNGLKIKLPEDDIGYALRTLAAEEESENILDKDLETIDLRDPSRMIVRTRPGAAQEYNGAYHDYKAGFQPASNSTSSNI